MITNYVIYATMAVISAVAVYVAGTPVREKHEEAEEAGEEATESQ